MKPAPAIEVRDVCKRFRMQGGNRTLKAAAIETLRGARRQGRDFWALREVSFAVEPGETVGIIGANGAGKSTLLALVAGTMEPTSGAIQTRGAISSLLELGAGFHPDLSGRENVFLAGAIMGMGRARMRERFDAIVEFAELNEYIDEPVKHYSSGMYVRLGFAVAVEVDPDILLVDEVLAVGDAVFERKCIERMTAFRRAGKSMLVISHDMETIKKVSDRILLLDQGRVLESGTPSEVVGHYRDLSHLRHREGLQKEWGTRQAEFLRVEVFDDSGAPRKAFAWDEPVTVRIHYRAHEPVPAPVVGFALADDMGRKLAGSNSQIEGQRLPPLEVGEGAIELRFPRLGLSRGTYLLSLSMHSEDHQTNYHRLDNCFPIEIDSDCGFEGAFLRSEWRRLA